ncbi:MAG: hypothetical protein PVG51_12065 [Desulfosarcina sp.]|jgi:hypothetical protein
MGIASNKDKSLSMIYYHEMREGDAHFDGYMGHDSFRLVEHRWQLTERWGAVAFGGLANL